MGEHKTLDEPGRTTDHAAKLAERSLNLRPNADDPLAVFDPSPVTDGAVLTQFVFGGCQWHAPALARRGGEPPWPLTWAHGDVCSGAHLGGAQAIVLDPARALQPVRSICLGGRVVGRAYGDAHADYCYLGGLLPPDPAAPRPEQARAVFEGIEAALEQTGMDFSHVARTWLYLDQLLEWYDPFNAVRTAFFNERGVFERLVPASTGIGAANPAGAAMVAGALAVRPRTAGVRVEEVASPLQCPATAYRSSFSRAVEIRTPAARRLLVSGTASIAPGGETIHLGDSERQIELTLDVVEAILESRGMGWAETTRAIAYFRDMADLSLFEAVCRRRGMPALPFIPAHAIVCRDDLLFELELDAALAEPRPAED